MNFDYVRKIVSGKKARFIDPEAAVNLDLVYVTDRIIIMGYPATGFESLYRNRRTDVLRFIESRHSDNWWIFNLCPVYENAYSPESMKGRVSRYPFPDHHPPPLALLPIAVGEMKAWLEGGEERVGVIHCKAGKGRSGTLLCSYMLSLDKLPPPPQLDRSYTYKELLKRRLAAADREPGADGNESDWVSMDETGRDSVDPGADATASAARQDNVVDKGTRPGLSNGPKSGTGDMDAVTEAGGGDEKLDRNEKKDAFVPLDVGDTDELSAPGQWDRRDGKLEKVFKLHSSRRMKPSSTGRGVSIPSQRRWCRYVHLLYTHQVPSAFLLPDPPRIRLLSVSIVLSSPSGWKRPVTSVIVGTSSKHPHSHNRAWASVARYRDDYVDKLQDASQGVDGKGQVTWGGIGGKGEFDSHKMFRGCGKFVAGEISEEDREALTISKDKDEIIHHLVPAKSEAITLDRCREVRLKLHIGSLPLGWLWFIPAFHLPEPLPGASSSVADVTRSDHVPVAETEGPISSTSTSTSSSWTEEANKASSSRQQRYQDQSRIQTLCFPKSQIDFAIGPGAAIRRVLVRIEEVPQGVRVGAAPQMNEKEEEEAGVAKDNDERGDWVKEE